MKVGDVYKSRNLLGPYTVVEIDEYRGYVTIENEIGGTLSLSAHDWYYLELYRIQQAQCEHSWIDTGMRKTYCKHCDTTGWLDPMTGMVAV